MTKTIADYERENAELRARVELHEKTIAHLLKTAGAPHVCPQPVCTLPHYVPVPCTRPHYPPTVNPSWPWQPYNPIIDPFRITCANPAMGGGAVFETNGQWLVGDGNAAGCAGAIPLVSHTSLTLS